MPRAGSFRGAGTRQRGAPGLRSRFRGLFPGEDLAARDGSARVDGAAGDDRELGRIREAKTGRVRVLSKGRVVVLPRQEAREGVIEVAQRRLKAMARHQLEKRPLLLHRGQRVLLIVVADAALALTLGALARIPVGGSFGEPGIEHDPARATDLTESLFLGRRRIEPELVRGHDDILRHACSLDSCEKRGKK